MGGWSWRPFVAIDQSVLMIMPQFLIQKNATEILFHLWYYELRSNPRHKRYGRFKMKIGFDHSLVSFAVNASNTDPSKRSTPQLSFAIFKTWNHKQPQNIWVWSWKELVWVMKKVHGLWRWCWWVLDSWVLLYSSLWLFGEGQVLLDDQGEPQNNVLVWIFLFLFTLDL